MDALFTRSSLLTGSAGEDKGKCGVAVSRNEGKIGESGGKTVDAAEILAALAKDSAGSETRRDAVRLYLSASEGWREASATLGGAFAAGDERARSDEEE